MKVFAKKFGIVFIAAALYCLPIQAMSVMGVLGAATTALTVSAALAPVITPIAKEVITQTKAQLPKVQKLLSKDTRCKQACDNISRITCSTKRGTSYCKSRCQKMIKVGAGYTLKIRFTDKWNMQKCVAFATKTKKHTFKEENAKSIAIYGENDFDLATEVISQLVALDKFILLNGRVPETKDMSTEEINQLVEDAKEDRKTIDENFQEFAHENFGPQ